METNYFKMFTRNYVFIYLLVKLSHVYSLIVSGTQSTWSDSEKFCADHNNHLITPESLLAMDRLSGDICDVAVGNKVWIFGVTYQLGCDKGKCQNIEVRRLPSDTELDFLCQSNTNIYYATGSHDKPYHLAMSGCGPKIQGWPRLANMSTNLSAIQYLIDNDHIKENQLYWVQGFNLNWPNKTCKALQRTHQSFAKLINIPCDVLAKTACNQGIGHSQKAVRYYLTDGSQDNSTLPLSCSEFDIDIITTEPRVIDYVYGDGNYDDFPGVESSDVPGNFSSNSTDNSNNTLVTTDNLWNIKTLYIISGAAGGGVVVLAVIVVVAGCCARKQVEVMPYGEPKDMIRAGSQYRYEHPYDTRKNCEKVIKIKALNKDSDNYDYPDVVIDTEKSKVLSNTYDEVIPTNSSDGGSSIKTPETCEKNVLLQEENMTSKSSTNMYSYIDVALGPKFVNTQHFDTERNPSNGVNIENSRAKEEPVYL